MGAPLILPNRVTGNRNIRLELNEHPLAKTVVSYFLFQSSSFDGHKPYPLNTAIYEPKYGPTAGNYGQVCGGNGSDDSMIIQNVGVSDLFPQGLENGCAVTTYAFLTSDNDERNGIIECPANDSNAVRLYVENRSIDQWRFTVNVWSDRFASYPVTLNKWQGVVGVYEGSVARRTHIFVDGEKGTSADFADPTTATETETMLGGVFPTFRREWNGGVALIMTHNRTLSDSEALELSRNPWMVFRAVRAPTYFILSGVPSPAAGLTGTATEGIDGNDIRLGGKQIIITLSNDTWVAGASFDAQRQAIIDGLDAATTPTNGWNNEVRDNLPVTSVVRVNDTIANVNLNAQPGYNVFAQEVITSTIPADALVTSVSDLTATPTFTVDPGDKGPATPDTFNEVTPQDTQLSASVGTVTDPDGLAAIPFNVTPANEPDNGTLTSFSNTTGDYLYDPNPSYVGPDQFIVTVTDLKGFTSSVTVNIDVQASASAAVEGTVVPTANESDIVTGGEVIDIRLTGDEWVAAGPTFDAVRQDIINGLNSDGVELTGWNNEVRDKEVVTAVNRASNTLVRITLSPSAAYAIDNSETITVTVPAVALVTTTTDFDASPTFSIIPEAVSGVAPGGLQGPGQQVMPNAVTRLGGVVDE